MIYDEDAQFVNKIIQEMIKTSKDGKIYAYVITALQPDDVTIDDMFDRLIVKSSYTGKTYKIPDAIGTFLEDHPEVADLINTEMLSDEMTSNDEIAREVAYRLLLFPDMFEVRYVRNTRSIVHIALTEQSANDFIEVTPLESPTIVERELYNISRDVHALISCFTAYRTAGAVLR